MKTPTTGACFAIYTLPHVLFVDGFEERRRIAMVCCLAWNISLFPDARQREEHIEMVWNMGLNDNPLRPPDGMEHGWKSKCGCSLRKKHDLFPRLMRRIPKADLVQKNPHDVLRIQTDDGTDEIPLVTHPRVEGLPHIIPALHRMREDTEKQVETLQQIAQIPGDSRKLWSRVWRRPIARNARSLSATTACSRYGRRRCPIRPSRTGSVSG